MSLGGSDVIILKSHQSFPTNTPNTTFLKILSQNLTKNSNVTKKSNDPNTTNNNRQNSSYKQHPKYKSKTKCNIKQFDKSEKTKNYGNNSSKDHPPSLHLNANRNRSNNSYTNRNDRKYINNNNHQRNSNSHHHHNHNRYNNNHQSPPQKRTRKRNNRFKPRSERKSKSKSNEVHSKFNKNHYIPKNQYQQTRSWKVKEPKKKNEPHQSQIQSPPKPTAAKKKKGNNNHMKRKQKLKVKQLESRVRQLTLDPAKNKSKNKSMMVDSANGHSKHKTHSNGSKCSYHHEWEKYHILLIQDQGSKQSFISKHKGFCDKEGYKMIVNDKQNQNKKKGKDKQPIIAICFKEEMLTQIGGVYGTSHSVGVVLEVNNNMNEHKDNENGTMMADNSDKKSIPPPSVKRTKESNTSNTTQTIIDLNNESDSNKKAIPITKPQPQTFINSKESLTERKENDDNYNDDTPSITTNKAENCLRTSNATLPSNSNQLSKPEQSKMNTETSNASNMTQAIINENEESDPDVMMKSMTKDQPQRPINCNVPLTETKENGCNYNHRPSSTANTGQNSQIGISNPTFPSNPIDQFLDPSMFSFFAEMKNDIESYQDNTKALDFKKSANDIANLMNKRRMNKRKMNMSPSINLNHNEPNLRKNMENKEDNNDNNATQRNNVLHYNVRKDNVTIINMSPSLNIKQNKPNSRKSIYEIKVQE